MKVCRSFEFDAAHRLPEYQGKCANLHGHRWKVEIELSGDIDPKTGMVMDFSDLKEFMNPIISKLDHNYINDIIPTPTAENIVLWLRKEIMYTSAPIYSLLSKIRIYETPDSYAEY